MVYHQYLNSGGTFNYNAFVYKDFGWSKHFHKNYELAYVIDGSVQVTTNSEIETLEKDELILISPNVVHSFKTQHSSCVWVAVFSEDFISAFAKANENSIFSKYTCDEKVRNFLCGNLFFQGTPERYTAIGCLNLACAQCLKHARRGERGREDITGAIIDYVSKHICDNITLADIAEALGYEYHYFSAIFKNCMSMSFKEFINLYRFEAACELLNEGNLKLTQIAMESGFQSVRNFNRIFKQLSGITPNMYLKNLQERI